MKGMSMRAAVVRKVGGPEVIEVLEVPTPEPGPLQVRIKVVAAALNPADAAVWAGFFGSLEGMEHAGLGLDAAGTIDAVGPGVLLEVGTAVIAFDAATPLLFTVTVPVPIGVMEGRMAPTSVART